MGTQLTKHTQKRFYNKIGDRIVSMRTTIWVGGKRVHSRPPLSYNPATTMRPYPIVMMTRKETILAGTPLEMKCFTRR